MVWSKRLFSDALLHVSFCVWHIPKHMTTFARTPRNLLENLPYRHDFIFRSKGALTKDTNCVLLPPGVNKVYSTD